MQAGIHVPHSPRTQPSRRRHCAGTRKRARYLEERIIWILKEHRPCFRRRICAASMGSATRRFTRGGPKDGGMDVVDSKKVESSENENRRLKRLLAESVLDTATLKEMQRKNC
jgi:putative transposase